MDRPNPLYLVTLERLTVKDGLLRDPLPEEQSNAFFRFFQAVSETLEQKGNSVQPRGDRPLNSCRCLREKVLI